MRFLLVMIVSIFLFTACSKPHIGMEYEYAITSAKAKSIITGVTTRKELDEMFGPPEAKMRSEKKIIYFYKDYNLNAVWVTFDNNEVVTDIDWFD
ncbi:hypothetical protein MNBD_NITROSPINAE02-976 [hydrothermal vent metagenome]|uniref:Lipoprotein SmpA/OmlA domain-containing protein n=1 Tax=hydrothermal vent metagenome TaxID=652676 RepID=A0A3B1C8R2_9ZZZZ